MLEELSKYYHEKGISPIAFSCRHWLTCSEGNQKITQAKCAFVGTGYEKGLLPRLLFLSLDPGCSDSEPNRRTVESVRYLEEHECKVVDLPKPRHWYRTHELAWILLKRFWPEMKIQDSHLYFAHANTVKCSMNNSNHKQARPHLFKSCREYVSGEVTILNPDIIVTQGNEAKAAIQNIIKSSEETEDKNICSYRWLHIGGRRILWLHTYHPSNYGKFNQQRRECFENWAEFVYGIFKK